MALAASAEQLYLSQGPEVAAVVVKQGLASCPESPKALARLYVLEGIMRFDAFENEEARAAFAAGLALDEATQFPDFASPRARRLFDAVKAQRTAQAANALPAALALVKPVDEVRVSGEVAKDGDELAAPFGSEFNLGIALAPAVVLGLPNTYLAGDFELRAAFEAMPFLPVILVAGGGESLLIGMNPANGPDYTMLGTWHAGLGVQASFGDLRQGTFAELVAEWRSYTAAPSALGYLGEAGHLEILAGGGWRLRVADHRLDLGLRVGFTPGARSAFGLQLLAGGWIF